ncbi:MAG: CRISPR-associated endoribonuclease Cas6 [Cyanobacteria bacterium J06555_13]
MPYSLILNLTPLSPIPKTHLTGRHLHALFLDLIRAHNPDLATTLHGQTTRKAFTLSPLQTNLNRQQTPGMLQWSHRRAISASTPCWWRITLLDDTLFAQLAPLWLGLSKQAQWHLGGSPIQVTRVIGTQQAGQPWATYLPYDQLYAQASSTNRKLPFRLCTPTNFRISDYDSCIPTRDRVFKSLLKRWNHYSAMPFPEDIISAIYPSELNLHSELATDSRSKFIGSVGTLTFNILGDLFPSTIQQINTLASFALYAGIGRKTPMGMGQTFYAPPNLFNQDNNRDSNRIRRSSKATANHPKPVLREKQPQPSCQPTISPSPISTLGNTAIAGSI